MKYFKCGHDRTPEILQTNMENLEEYCNWVETTGTEGDKTQCWKCYKKNN